MRESPSDPRFKRLSRSPQQIDHLSQALKRFAQLAVADSFTSPQFGEVRGLPGAHVLRIRFREVSDHGRFDSGPLSFPVLGSGISVGQASP